MTIMPRNKQQFREPRPVVDNTETETVWSIGINNTTMDDNTTMEEEEESPPVFSRSSRGDTINSTTQFFSLTEVQPQNTERYSGVSISLNVTGEEQISLQETRAGTKRLNDGNLQ